MRFLVLWLLGLGFFGELSVLAKASDPNEGAPRVFERALLSPNDPLPGEPNFRPENLAWQKIAIGTPDFRKADETQVLRFQIPSFAAEEVTLQWNYTHPMHRGGLVGCRAFLVTDGQFEELEPLKARFASYNLARSAYGKELYLVLSNNSYSIKLIYNMKIEERSRFHRTQEWNHFIIGIISGSIGIIALFNLWILVHFRQEYSFFHFIYCLSILIINSAANGLLEFNNSNMVLILSAMIGWMVSLVRFSMSFFQAKTNFPKAYLVGRGFLVFALLAYFGLLSNQDFIVKNTYYMTPLFIAFCLYLAIRSALERFRPAYVILVGWSVLALSFVIVSVQITWNLPIELGWASPFAAIIEITCFTFAINSRIRLNELSYQNRIEHAFGEMSKIVYKHQVESIKLGGSLESTMPTYDAKAFVLSFDIIRSSRIKSPNAKELFRQVFLRCNSLMSEGYSEHTLTARAYRIKEVGDGFLCSIGYPFTSLTSYPADEAVELARACVMVLAEESAKLLPDEDTVCCGIGIAYGDIAGFYPPSGAKEYDLFGRSIIHATRYESMRKRLFPELKNSSVLIIQDLVYEKLSPSLQAGFSRIDLLERHSHVRDDERASSLYVEIFTY